ncbi:MAG: RbsD/FucU domain-containing protein, partial [Verrucomicrobiota bacterium]|nr:RbsD/FucU domain-containing protein [Verrucomicrobiota bacterium]
VLPLFVLDHVIEQPVMMMGPLPEDKANPEIAADYQKVHDGYAEIVKKHYPDTAPIAQVDKYDFYDRTRKAFAVVMTGDVRIYANLILAKGVTTW